MAVGERVTLVFEDRETLRWQIQEMCRVEEIRDRSAVQREVDVYNELLPGEGELSATLFVEITDAERIRAELDRLIGIDEHVTLLIGDERVRARFDEKQMEEDRISAVQYIRFALTPDLAARFQDASVPASVAIDHPAYVREARIPGPVRTSLAAGLSGDPTPLVDPSWVNGEARDAAPRPVAEHGRARAVRADRPRGRDHWVVEAREPDAPPFESADSELLADVLVLAQRLARELRRSHGSCRVSFDTSAERLRCEVIAPAAVPDEADREGPGATGAR
jgi:hypothetical protein